MQDSGINIMTKSSASPFHNCLVAVKLIQPLVFRTIFYQTGDILRKRPITPSYIVFYILFLPDSWRILIGCIAAWLLTPFIVKPDMGISARVILYVMTATIGYAGSGVPARWITRFFKKLILGDKH